MSSAIQASIKAAQKDAMRNRDKERLGTIRMILAECKRIEVDERIELDDERVLVVLDKMQKQRRDSLAQFEAAGREDLSEVERTELEVIKTFLPTQLTDEELEQLIDSAIESTGASSMQDMGKVMGVIKPQAQGRADMGQLSQKIKAKLS